MNKRSFIKNGALMSAVGILMRTVTLLFAAYISRAVGAEGVGLNTLIMSAYGFALTFATSGINLTVTRLVAAHIGEGSEQRIGATLRGATAYALVFSVSATAVLAGFSGFFARDCLGDVRAVLPLQILSLSLMPSALLGVISGYFVALRKVGRNSAVQLVSQALRIVITVLVLTGVKEQSVEKSVSALCIGVSLCEFISLLIAAFIFWSDRRGARKRESGGISISPVAETALPLALSSYIRSGLLSVEHGIIPRRLQQRGDSVSESLASFGTLHGMALPMVTYPMTPLSSFASLLMPEFAEAEAAGNDRRMSRIAGMAVSATLSYGIIAAVMLFIFSEELGYSVYGSYSAGYFISVLAPVVPIMYIDHVVDSMLKGIGEQVYSMWVNICDSALSVLLVWLLIPVLGIEGYAIVIIAMEGFNFLLSYLRLRKRIRVKVNLIQALIMPLSSALLAAVLVDSLFVSVSTIGAWAVALKLVFALCCHTVFMIIANFVYNRVSSRNKEI